MLRPLALLRRLSRRLDKPTCHHLVFVCTPDHASHGAFIVDDAGAVVAVVPHEEAKRAFYVARSADSAMVAKVEVVETSLGSTLLHGILNGLGSAVDAVGSFVEQIANGVKGLIDRFIIEPIRGIHIQWGGFHGIGAFDIHPFDFIPRLHTGGIFQSEMGEGLALLKDGEGVFTASQMRAMGRAVQGGDFIYNAPAGTDPRKVNAALKLHERRNGKAA